MVVGTVPRTQALRVTKDEDELQEFAGVDLDEQEVIIDQEGEDYYYEGKEWALKDKLTKKKRRYRRKILLSGI